ncbi:MAG: hypothetical protein H6713_40935 [Myxococcales bacterium]|nr:hypothetical protein [Myxococcales bacterium]
MLLPALPPADAMRHWLRITMTLALALQCACSGDVAVVSDAEAATAVADAPRVELGDAPLADGSESLEQLGRRVVEALNARDVEALRRLAITEAEFKTRLFEVLSNHESARQIGPDLLWSMQRGESDDDLGHILDLHGGRAYEFAGVEPDRVERREGVTLHRTPTLVVRSPDASALLRLRLLASVVEHDETHTFKLIAYRLRGGDS